MRLMRWRRESQAAPTSASWATARASWAWSTRNCFSRPAARGVHQPDPVEHARGAWSPPGGSPAGARSGWSPSRCPRSAAGRASGAGSDRRPPTTGRRRPSRLMRLAPTCAAYGGSRGRKKSHPLTWSAYSAATFASSQPRSRKPVSVIRSSVPPPAAGSSSKTHQERVALRRRLALLVGPAEREQPRRDRRRRP